MTTEKSEKIEGKFVCDYCNYICKYKCDYVKHTMTRKHKMATNDDKKSDETTPKKYICLCGKKYSSRQGLHRHKKKCILTESSHDEDIHNDIFVNDRNVGDGFSNEMKHMFFGVMQQNKEMLQTIITQQQQLSELIRKSV